MEEFLARYPYLIPVAIVTFWCVVLSVLARLSGWTALSEYYRAEGDFDGPKRRFQSMRLGRGGFMDVNFSGCVTFGVDQRALRLSMLFLFRPFHPPLSIPLSDLSAERRKALIFETVRLQSSKAPEIGITIAASQARWIEENSGGVWIMPPSDNATVAPRP